MSLNHNLRKSAPAPSMLASTSQTDHTASNHVVTAEKYRAIQKQLADTRNDLFHEAKLRRNEGVEVDEARDKIKDLEDQNSKLKQENGKLRVQIDRQEQQLSTLVQRASTILSAKIDTATSDLKTALDEKMGMAKYEWLNDFTLQVALQRQANKIKSESGMLDEAQESLTTELLTRDEGGRKRSASTFDEEEFGEENIGCSSLKKRFKESQLSSSTLDSDSQTSDDTILTTTPAAPCLIAAMTASIMGASTPKDTGLKARKR